MVDETEKLEILKEEEDDRQQRIDSFKNYDFKTITSSSSEETLSEKQQNEEDEVILRRGHDATSDQGTYISHEDDFFQVIPPPKKRKTVMVAQCEIMEDLDDGKIHKEFSGYEGGATMETYEEYQEEGFSSEETNYTTEFTDYTYDATTMY
jgi:hypothetical protein